MHHQQPLALSGVLGTLPVRAATWFGKLIVIMVATVAFAVSFSSVAEAGTATSARGVYTVSGVRYLNKATIMTQVPTPTSIQGLTATGPDTTSASAGWVGSLGRAIDASNNSLVCSSVWSYNTATLSAGSYHTALCVTYGTGAWYSKGKSKAYSGSAWSEWFTFPSPNQNS